MGEGGRQRGREEGRDGGRKEGREEGREKGRQERREEGSLAGEIVEQRLISGVEVVVLITNMKHFDVWFEGLAG